MDAVLLSRIQFGSTIAFHYIFPVLSIGLGVILVIMEGLYLKTNNPLYHRMTHFWVSVFALIFAIGVATGIVMEFQFGTNWAAYSRYVGDVFGSALAAEGLYAFFLESGFLAVLVFGWNKVSKLTHFLATVAVALGAHFSAIWIVVANSWQQTPAGSHVVRHGLSQRAEITDFWAMVFNPSSVDRLLHVIGGAWGAGAFLVLSVGAYYLLRNRHTEFARASVKIALCMAVVSSVFQLVTGHQSAEYVHRHQPSKFAAMEGHYDASAPARLSFVGWVDEKRQQTHALAIPGGTSFLLYGDFTRPVVGLRAIPRENWPPVNITFQTYHLMVASGMAMLGLSMLGLLLWWRGWLFNPAFIQGWAGKAVLAAFVLSVALPQISNQTGWYTACIGRQPWIVWNQMRTKDGVSESVTADQVLGSIIGFGLVYTLVGALFIYLLNRKIQKGPDVYDPEPYHRDDPISRGQGLQSI